MQFILSRSNMKNVSIILLNMSAVVSAFNSTYKAPNHESVTRQPRFYGPLLGTLLANLLSFPISARLTPYGSSLQFRVDPHHRPISQYHSGENIVSPSWHSEPASLSASAYGAPEHYPVTTAIPQIHVHHHHSKPSNNQQQIVTIHERPSDVVIEENDVDTPTTVQPTGLTSFDTSSKPYIQDLTAAHSSRIYKREKAPNDFKGAGARSYGRRKATTYRPQHKRGTQFYYANKKINEESGKRRKYTTIRPSSYYDSYEDYSTEKSRRKSQPKRPANSYEISGSSYSEEEEQDDYDYEESYEYTTRRPYKKRRRTTTRRYNNMRYKNKNKKRQDFAQLYDEDNYDFNYRGPSNNFNVGPRQETTTVADTTTTTTTETTTTTTTTTQTSITNGTTAMPHNNTTTTNSTGYGYGPSNGNENISITYGPPTGHNTGYGPPRPSYGPPYYPQYNAQYSDWYENEATRNAIVQKVHDVIGIDRFFQNRYL